MESEVATQTRHQAVAPDGPQSRWHSGWLIGLTTALNCVFYPIASYLLPTVFYFYGRYELAHPRSFPGTLITK